MGVLRNQKRELFAQGIVKGLSAADAAVAAGYKSGRGVTKLRSRPEVDRRINELLGNAARRAELSRADILNRIYDDWNLARKLGQMGPALKAGELIGKELHKMFVDRKEVGGPGDFDGKSEAELREIINKNLKELQDQGVDTTQIGIKLEELESEESSSPPSSSTLQ